MRNGRKLSWWRVSLLLLLLLGAAYGARREWRQQQERAVQYEETQRVRSKAWFGAYVDVTATPRYEFEQLGATVTPNVVLAFIVASKTDPCVPTWGAAYNLEEAGSFLDLDRRIARLQQQGGNVIVSFGGLLNDELAVACADEEQLRAAYQQVIDRYHIETIDLDLENTGLTNLEAGRRRAQVLKKLQDEVRATGGNLAIWLTLPVAPQGLTEDGTRAVALFLEEKVDLAGINVMTMDYGGSKNPSDSMAEASQQALIQTHRQLGILYEQAGIKLSPETLWGKLGATPMIGQNDVLAEVFDLEDAEQLNSFAITKGLGRMSMWSANRDVECGDNYADVRIVSDSCSGVKQSKYKFGEILTNQITGDPANNAKIVTVADGKVGEQIQDNPENSPYQIWQEYTTYLADEKVVWHGNVYQAKWWTKGDLPDNPVLQTWETPWQLIGPVLPGEKPVPRLTLPNGHYPQWNAETIYEAGDRVLLKGTPYEAKWWNQGESPEAAAYRSESSPWTVLSQKEVSEIIKQTKKKSKDKE